MSEEPLTEEDNSLYESYSKIKRIDRFCKIMVTKNQRPICERLHEQVVIGEINSDEYFSKMKAKFNRNKKFTKTINFVKNEERR